jgi:hypothetical protein
LIKRAKRFWFTGGVISNIVYKSVHVVYRKLNETKFLLDFAMHAGLF